MLEGIENIFADRTEMMDSLKKNAYADRTERFVNRHGHFFEEMAVYVEQSDDPDAAAVEIGKRIVDAAKKVGVNQKGKLDAKTRAGLHMFMIYYVFPTMLKQGPIGKTIADGVLKVWRKEMKNKDMSYTDYDTLYNGFRERIFGF